MKRIIVFALLILCQGILYPQTKNKETIDCKSCHDCAIPTKDNPCLKKCPRDLMNVVYHMPLSIPKILIIDHFKGETDLYPPVKFSHQTHAEMASMSGSCQMCHHYNPTGSILACNKCHEEERKRTDISKIDLKGAYHVQCMGCHRAWSNEIECNTCHNQPAKGAKSPSTKQVHTTIKRPTVKVFETTYNKGKLVTFNHDEHFSTFGVDCVQCHNEDGCIKCHNKSKTPVASKGSLRDMHKVCSKCHNVQDNCSSCHSDQKRGLFNHLNVAGWQLNRFHIKLTCDRCHTDKGKFSHLDTQCTTCHSKWTQQNFDHKKTGLALDETHAGNDCDNCHVEKNFANPVCTGCHDETYKYPDKKPGKLIKKA